jgi:hypothetical protein
MVISYWMSQDSFYLFDGSVKKLPCSVEQFVFNNINQTASENAFAGHNGEFNEIIWFYARTGSDQINAIVAYNYQEGYLVDRNFDSYILDRSRDFMIILLVHNI